MVALNDNLLSPPRTSYLLICKKSSSATPHQLWPSNRQFWGPTRYIAIPGTSHMVFFRRTSHSFANAELDREVEQQWSEIFDSGNFVDYVSRCMSGWWSCIDRPSYWFSGQIEIHVCELEMICPRWVDPMKNSLRKYLKTKMMLNPSQREKN